MSALLDTNILLRSTQPTHPMRQVAADAAAGIPGVTRFAGEAKKTRMSKRQRIVWVVMHYEIMGLPDSPRVDSVQFHMSSSLNKAEEYIHSVHVDWHSWWQVHPHVIDAPDYDEGEKVYYYSHRGTRLRSAPILRAITAFRKHTARHPDFYPSCPPKQM
jgi:hypothetical protein